jgi:DNA polymerase-3 subunit alpha
MGLFGTADSSASSPEPDLPRVGEWDDLARLEHEHEAVGFYISGHPLDRYVRDVTFLGAVTTQALEGKRDQDMVAIAGVTNTVRRKNSKKGDRYATFNLEDREGVVEVIAWPDTYKKCEAAIVGREPVFVSGRLELGEHRRGPALNTGDEEGDASVGYAMKPQIIAEEVVSLTERRRARATVIDLRVRADALAPAALQELRSALKRFPGGCKPELHILRPGETETTIELARDLYVDPTDGLLQAVEKLLGPGSASFR